MKHDYPRILSCNHYYYTRYVQHASEYLAISNFGQRGPTDYHYYCRFVRSGRTNSLPLTIGGVADFARTKCESQLSQIAIIPLFSEPWHMKP